MRKVSWRRAQAAVAVAVAASLLLPWATSGHRTRSGFALARSVHAAGMASGLSGRTLALGVTIVPGLAGLAAVSALRRAPALSSIAAVLTGAAIVVVGAVVVRSSLHREVGPGVAIALGLVSVAAGLGGALSRRAAVRSAR